MSRRQVKAIQRPAATTMIHSSSDSPPAATAAGGARQRQHFGLEGGVGDVHVRRTGEQQETSDDDQRKAAPGPRQDFLRQGRYRLLAANNPNQSQIEDGY